MGDTMSLDAALAAFVAASDQPCENLDLTLGRSGTLLIGALLLEASAKLAPAGVEPLVAIGHQTLDSLWRELDTAPPIASAQPFTFAGIAHGWAGALYATLRWCQASGAQVPAGVAARLDELAGRATWHGHAAK